MSVVMLLRKCGGVNVVLFIHLFFVQATDKPNLPFRCMG